MHRPRMELAKTNKYYIDKNRRYELSYFCLQYDLWKKELTELTYYPKKLPLSETKTKGYISNPTESIVLKKVSLESYISLVEETAREADPELYKWILLGVTKGMSYVQLRTLYDLPCEKGTYYNRFQRFFWLLDKKR